MPKREKSREKEAGEARGFRVRTALLIVTLTALAVFYPILAGYVPFPADTVLSFPPWATHAKTICIGTSHAEMGDIVTQFYPWHSTLNAKLRKFEIPLWNQHVLMGTPFEAQPATGVFFPLNWAFAIVSAPSAWAWLFIIRTVIIGISTTLYLSRLEISAAGAMVSGLTFAFCGWVTAFQGRPQLDTAMWLPLMFLAVDYVREVPSRRSIALAAVAFALPVLGGHPEIAAQVILAGTCYALYRTFRASPGRVRYVGAFGVAAALSAMLAAVQIVPTFEWLGYIPRSLSNHWGALAPGQIIAFLSPDISRHPNVDGVSVPEAAAYAGTFGLAVLPFALFWRKRGDVVFFAALAAACIEIVYGWPPAYWISQHLPVLAVSSGCGFLHCRPCRHCGIRIAGSLRERQTDLPAGNHGDTGFRCSNRLRHVPRTHFGRSCGSISVDGSGNRRRSGDSRPRCDAPHQCPAVHHLCGCGRARRYGYFQLRVHALRPASRYIPGQRRVRLSPCACRGHAPRRCGRCRVRK